MATNFPFGVPGASFKEYPLLEPDPNANSTQWIYNVGNQTSCYMGNQYTDRKNTGAIVPRVDWVRTIRRSVCPGQQEDRSISEGHITV